MKFKLSATLFSLCMSFTGYAASSLSKNNSQLTKPPKPSLHKRVVVSDWDDTLFPTEATKELVKKEGLRPERAKEFEVLDNQAYDFLRSFILKDTPVFLISNGDTNWIWNSAKAWMPRTERLFCKNSNDKSCVFVVSAKDYFENLFPNLKNQPTTEFQGKKLQTPLLWKIYTFSAYLNSFDSIFSVGDGVAEEYAMNYLFDKTPSIHVKLPAKPSVTQMAYNLVYLEEVYDHLISANQAQTLTGCDMYFIYKLFEKTPETNNETNKK